MDILVHQCWKTNSQGQSCKGLYMCDVMVTRVCIVSVLVASCECVMEGAIVQAVAQPGPQMCCQLELMYCNVDMPI